MRLLGTNYGLFPRGTYIIGGSFLCSIPLAVNITNGPHTKFKMRSKLPIPQGGTINSII